MQKVVVFRFGPPIPIPPITNALIPHFASGKPMAIPVPGGVMSVFNTNSTIDEIATSIKGTELPIIFFVFAYSRTSTVLPTELADAIADALGDEVAEASTVMPNEPSATVGTYDQILDKINATGMSSLTEAELAVLKAGL